MVSWPIAFGSVTRQFIMEEMHGKGKCSPHSGKEEKRKT
jgi:hypothetical protein